MSFQNRLFVSISLVNSCTLLTLQKCSVVNFENPFKNNNWPRCGGLVGSTKPQYFTLACQKAYQPCFQPMVHDAYVGAWGGRCLISFVLEGLQRGLPFFGGQRVKEGVKGMIHSIARGLSNVSWGHQIATKDLGINNWNATIYKLTILNLSFPTKHYL